jgi:glycosyltransferase involved in cell wall biosynthesis
VTPSEAPPLALVTPARNEAASIGETIRSVTAQTVLPARWVVVSDGSTDGTDGIVADACRTHDWMRLVRLPGHAERDFSAKVRAFNAGREALLGVPYTVIGNLDADITFDEEYLAFLLEKFRDDPSLGVAGTPFVEEGRQYDYRFTSIEHVSGACQLFRRECFEAIGGYAPIRGGGIDWVAVTTARMMGWTTRTFTAKVCHHHRPMGTGNADPLGAWFSHGWKDYFLGGHPLWQVFRSLYQMTRRPYLVGGLLLLFGYIGAWLRRVPRPVSRELIAFHRGEQVARLRRLLSRKEHS